MVIEEKDMDYYKKKYGDKYKPQVNGLDTPQMVVKFFRDNCEFHNSGQGIIGITCDELWDMPLYAFYEIFGIPYEEEKEAEE